MSRLNSKKLISPVIALLGLLLISFLLLLSACSPRPKATPAPSLSPQAIPATPLWNQEEAIPAPLFQLTNQFGQVTSLSQLKGKVVVLTFLYTYCPHACPLTISKVQQAMTELGSLADEVALVAITVDPERDTVERLQEYTASLPSDWLYLTGEPALVKVVWASYGIYVKKPEEKIATQGQSPAGHEGYEVIHTTAVILIDKGGFQRSILLGLLWPPAELEEKLRLLLSE